MALLDVDGATGFTCGDEQIGLAAKKGGNLEDVDSLSGDFAVGRFVNVGEDGKAGVFGDAAEDARALFEARATVAPDAGAIGLVIAGFEDEGNADVGGDALDGFSDGASVSLGLDDAGTCNEEEPARAHFHRPDFERRTHEGNCTGGRDQVMADEGSGASKP
jgi:hypothetical protein